MQSQVSEIDPVTVELQMQVPWDRIQKGLDATFSKLQRTARVKGFRPGKAPRHVIQQLFSRDVRAEVTSNLVEESLVEAVRKHEIPVVSRPVMDAQPEIAEGQPLSFSVKFEVRPRIEELATQLTLIRPSTTVTDAEVDAEVETLRSQHAIIRPVEGDRPSAKGDIVVIDHEVEIDGVARADMHGEGRTVQLGEGRILEEIDAGLVGLKTSDTKDILVERAPEDSNPELAGKRVLFKVTVKEVRERILPDVDDEFAKDVGEYTSLAELRQKLRERLEDTARGRAEGALREQAVDKLVEANPVPVPPSLVEQQFRSMVQEYLQLMKMIGQQPDAREAFVEELRRRAADKVRAALLLGELARKASIEVSAEEVEERFRDIATRTGKHVAKVRADYAGEKRESLETQLLEDKLVSHLLSLATIEEAALPQG
jgi:trigger factor